MRIEGATVRHLFQVDRDLEEAVHRLAEKGRVAFSEETIASMTEQGVNDLEVERFIRQGTVLRTTRTNQEGKQSCRIVASSGRNRAAQIAAAVSEGRIFVTSVNWDQS